ncbi:MAG: HNH endonuclease family protein [Acidimicrobiaceae bacterium]
MKWRIAANGAALVIAISSVAYVDGETTMAAKPQKFVANDAKSVLASRNVENEYNSGYRRSLFVHWSDLDGNGCDTREDVLKRDSISKPQVDPYRCYVVAGDWYSKYDGKTLSDRSDVDIDHVVALKEAWDSGAWAWSMSQRQAFANDLTDRRTLIAVSDRVNASKSDKDPSNWMPPLKSYWCTYLSDWISVKARWGLSMDQSEFGRIKNLLASDCSTLTIAGWGAVPSLAGVPATSGTAATTATTTPRTTVAPSLSPTTSSNNSGTAATTNTTAVANSTVNTTSPSGVKDIYPGSYCAPVDGLGTYKGTVYVCSKTNAEGSPYAGGRARWRKATN